MKTVRTWDVGALRYVVTLEIEKIRPWNGAEYSALITDAAVENSGARSAIQGVPSSLHYGDTPFEAISGAMKEFERWLREQRITQRNESD